MIVDDSILYLLFVVIGFILMFASVFDDFRKNQEETEIRLMALPLLSALAFFIWAGMSFQLNNCLTEYGGITSGCFTSPTFATTTSTVFAFTFATALGYFGIACGIYMFLFTVGRIWDWVQNFLRTSKERAKRRASVAGSRPLISQR